MHDRIATLDSWYALQLEGSYISQYALRRFDPKYTHFPNIERGMGERLKMVSHDDTWGWIIHRYIMRRHGITIKGPSPLTLVDPILPNDLRQAMLPILHGWATQILNNPNKMDHQGYQSYVVLSLCRILYTLHFGDVVSKPVAAQWAKKSLDEKWVSLVERAWMGRHEPQLTATPEDVNQTLNFIRYAREQGEKSKI